ncbi:uncharacterized protein [Ptychodera flava]|uniref:uncharacterized protein n=1 Tax=Ptychodera flava TaxID=63121 RepID=UPI003969E432
MASKGNGASFCRFAVFSLSIILWAIVRGDDESYCGKCRLRIDINGREYEDNCEMIPSCPSDLLDMVQNIRGGLVNATGDSLSIISVGSSEEINKWLILPEGLIGKNLTMGNGPGDELLDLCHRCEEILFENGVTVYDCEEIECPDEFTGSFSLDPFQPVVAIVPSFTCLAIVGEEAQKFYCYYNI